MVADAQQQPATAEEEILKRNTDCVYFLASPLTCKKGSECEYRHSEYARVNPRDCWYWLNSNCLNPKCAFRHPPVEGLLGTQSVSTAGFAPSSSQQTIVAPIVAPVTSASQNSNKQAVPCIYFQKGYCMKGDKCSFLHGPNPPTSVKPAQASAPQQGVDSSNAQKVFVGLQKCTQEKKLTQASTPVSAGAPPRANPISKEFSLPSNGINIERGTFPQKSFDDERARSKPVSAPLTNGIQTNRPSRSHQVIVPSDHGFHNGKDTDEFMRESSPGFDVLVEDELRDQEYFHGEDQYGRLRAHDGRNLDVDEYDLDRPVSADVDLDRFREPRGFDSHAQGQYAWEPRRASLDRKAVGPPQFDRRGYRKSISPDNGLDLRHQLSKHKRVNGLRSVINRDYAHESHKDDRSHRDSRRDSQPVYQPKGPLSSRLRGRINFGSSTDGAESRVDRESDRGRSRGRVSPKRPQTSSYEGRFRDRLKGRILDDYNNEGIRNGGSSRTIRDITDNESTDFSGPRGLSELKRGKGIENKEPSILGKRKNPRTEASQLPEGVSFDGPMPLSEILKRKREAKSSQNSRPNLDKEEEEEGEVSNALFSNKEESKSKNVSVVAETKEGKIGVSNEEPNVNEPEAGEEVIYDETVGDQEIEADDDQAHGEYDYEHGEEELEEEEEEEYDVENAEGEEEEYLEDEEDDFAKKIGVMSS